MEQMITITFIMSEYAFLASKSFALLKKNGSAAYLNACMNMVINMEILKHALKIPTML